MAAQLVRLRTASTEANAASQGEVLQSVQQLHDEIDAIADALEELANPQGPMEPIVWILSRQVRELMLEATEQERLRARLGRYFSPSVLDRISTRQTQHGPSGEMREVTVLCADIRGFTQLTDRLGPERTVALVNRCFDTMVRVVFERGGTLDKFLGDGLLAYFSESVGGEGHATSAVKCALAMQERAATLNTADLDPEGPPLRIGIGLCTGMVLMGDIGSSERKEFTIIGDAANVASRLEALTKELGVPVLASETTRLGAAPDLHWRVIPGQKIRGKDVAVEVFAPELPAPAQEPERPRRRAPLG